MIGNILNIIKLPQLSYKWNKYNKDVYKFDYISRLSNRRLDILIEWFSNNLKMNNKNVYCMESSIIKYLSKNCKEIDPIYLNIELIDTFIKLPKKFVTIYVILKGNNIKIDNYVISKREYIEVNTVESYIENKTNKSAIILKLDYIVSEIDDIDIKYIRLFIFRNRLQNYYKYYIINNRRLNNKLFKSLMDGIIEKIENIEEDDIDEDILKYDFENNIFGFKEIKLLGSIGIIIGINSFLYLYEIMNKKNIYK